MKTILTILISATLAVTGTWFILKKPEQTTTVERKPLFYQSSMHPWVKSDKPGECTICGMALTPIYPGDQSFDAESEQPMVSLTQNQVQVLNVQTAEAKIQPLTRNLTVAGMIDDDARRHRLISAYVDGRIDKLYANHHGIEVVAGQPLAMIYSPTLLQAQREYRQLSGDLKANTSVRLQQMGLTQEQIKNLETEDPNALNTQLLAPLTGTVVNHEVYEGQYVTAGQKLFEIADFSIMWFQFLAYEQDMPWLEVGQTVQVTTPSIPGKSFSGKITFIDPNFDESTRATKVRVELPNPLVKGRRELLHRLYADGIVEISHPAVLTIPRSAVIQTGSQAVVYLTKDDSTYLQTPIQLGRRGDSLVEVISGLKTGDKVVTQGNLLIDGQAELNRAYNP